MSESQLTITPGHRPLLLKKVRLQQDRITGEPALLYPEGVLILNPTGADIIALCDGEHDVNQIIHSLAQLYDSPVDVLASDVVQYIERLRDKCLIEFRTDPPT